MVGGAGQRAGGDHQEALAVGDRFVGLELVRGDEAFDLVVLAGRLQVLADRQEIDIGGAQVVHQLQHLVALLAEADHDARFGEHGGIEFLHPLQQPDGMEVAGARADRQIVAGDRFHIVVEDIGLGGDDALQGARLLQEVRRQDFDRRCRRSGADRPDHLFEMFGAAVLEIVTVDRGDDDVAEAHFLDRLGDVLRLGHIERVRFAGGDIAEGAGRVQISPMIMKVACFLSQHSPIFGQPASSQTVTSLCSFTIARVSA